MCVRVFYKLYGMLQSDRTALMQQSSEWSVKSISSASLGTNCHEWNWKKDTDAQHTIIFIKVVRLTCLSSADVVLSLVAFSDIEMSW